MGYRTEHDTMGPVLVPEEHKWGAQTQRSLEHFRIGTEKIPVEIVRAFGVIKEACASVNEEMGKLDKRRASLIREVCLKIREGKLDPEFPLAVWQTGSGTQTNMNINEVIAFCGNELAGETLLHPNDHVNMSQSSNDTFPTALNVAAAVSLNERLFPAADRMIEALKELELKHEGIVKTGRTHLQDAVPIRFSQEISGWRGMLENQRSLLEKTQTGLFRLALGGTAVGTGLNAPKGFDWRAAERIGEILDLPFEASQNKFHALTALDSIASVHGVLKALAADLMKIANDIRWLASGPRCGLGEIRIPANEPGSSIMPGKVNPTQCEAVTMVAAQVMGNDVTIGIAASQGNFQLNVFQPVTAYNFHQSVRLLSDAMESFTENCLKGLEADEAKMRGNLSRSLMNVTALSPLIGYEKAAQAAKYAHEHELTIREACLELGLLDENTFDNVYRPEEMADQKEGV
ncbi:MAG: class II fumarate hydratase [Clostridia bacterium]|nr:class II fumarate hydratase [Clostridia bacterium]